VNAFATSLQSFEVGLPAVAAKQRRMVGAAGIEPATSPEGDVVRQARLSTDTEQEDTPAHYGVTGGQLVMHSRISIG
jgi:hypothetical protein